MVDDDAVDEEAASGEPENDDVGRVGKLVLIINVGKRAGEGAGRPPGDDEVGGGPPVGARSRSFEERADGSNAKEDDIVVDDEGTSMATELVNRGPSAADEKGEDIEVGGVESSLSSTGGGGGAVGAKSVEKTPSVAGRELKNGGGSAGSEIFSNKRD